MKKIIFIILTFFVLVPSMTLAAAITCTESMTEISAIYSSITLSCAGGLDDTTISLSTEANAFAKGKLLYSVSARKTPTGHQPDAADVQVKVWGLDLLGGKGVNLIPATDITNEVTPYNTFTGLYRYAPIDGAITVPIANEGTAGWDAEIKLMLSR